MKIVCGKQDTNFGAKNLRVGKPYQPAEQTKVVYPRAITKSFDFIHFEMKRFEDIS